MNIINQYWHAWRYNIRAKRLLRKFGSSGNEFYATHSTVLEFLGEDNKRLRTLGVSRMLRDQAAIFWKGIRRYSGYQVIDYSDARKLYYKLLQLGVNPELSANCYLGCWVTAVSSSFAYKGKEYQSYGSGWICAEEDTFKPYTFLVGYACGHTVVEVGQNDMGWNKNQIRLATDKEIGSVIEKQFILSDN